MNTTVLAAGVFDFFHPGHQAYLRQARALGSKLVVIIARDASVLRIKGFMPTHDEQTRAAAVRAAGIADTVWLGDKNNFMHSIARAAPQIIALGYDQRLPNIPLPAAIQIVRLAAEQPERFKSSLYRNN